MKTLIGITILAAAAAILPMQAPPSAEVPQYHLPDPVSDADFYDNGAPAKEKMELGRVLFFDKILSGNKNISCATCHHPKLGTSDGVALGFGEGADGLGQDRKPGKGFENGVHERVPRNSPALFNVGAKEFTRMFHDGRVETDSAGYYEGGFITPAKWKLPEGLDNVLAAQAMFPVTSPAEMAGQKGENEIADQRSLNNVAGPGGVWEIIAKRLQAIPEYVERFKAAYPGQVESADDITMVLAANAIAAFEAECFRADNSEFDRYLRGQARMSRKAKRGMDLFYGEAGCGDCHGGKFQTDQSFHAIAMPQVGPGKGDGRDGSYWSKTGHKAFLEDFGRGAVTVREKDNFKFRTPSLRNVAITGPWGHDGAYDSLEEVVRHHLDPEKCLDEYECDDDMLFPLDRVLELTARGSQLNHTWMNERRTEGFNQRDTWVQENDKLRSRIAEANELEAIELTDEEVDDLVAFLEALTDPATEDLSREIPDEVPSGLPVDK
jgi:cytochrome c peroxidase